MNTVSRSTVVVGLDPSDPGRAAVEYAAKVAHRRVLPLRMLHASCPVAIVHPENRASRP